jgi:hypothetical protein
MDTDASDSKNFGARNSMESDVSSDSLVTICRRLEERAKSKIHKALKADVIRLPIWPDTLRGVPNGVLRSALFGAVKRGPRRQITREFVATLDGYEIRYTGARLDQSDLDVWEALLHLARQQALGNRVETSERALIKSIGRAYGKSGREWLKNVAARLSATTVEFTRGERTYGGSLVDEFYRDDKIGCYVVVLNAKLQALFARDDWTSIEWAQRQALKGKPLAQWLHGFYSTHAEPYPLKVQTLHRLSGSETKQLKHFRADLRESMTKVDHATGWQSGIDENDLLHVRKPQGPNRPSYRNSTPTS